MSGDYGLCDLAVVSLHDNEHEPNYGIQLTPDGHINTTESSSKLPEDSYLAIIDSKFDYTNGSANTASSTDVSSGGEFTVCAAHQADLDQYCRTEGRPVCQKCVNQGTCRNHTVIQLNVRAAAVRVSHETLNKLTPTHVLLPSSCSHYSVGVIIIMLPS